MSRLRFYIKNFLFLSIIFIGGAILLHFTSEEDLWWMELILHVIGFVIIPLASDISWDFKYRNK
jgi:hypothetical protein